MRTRKLLVPLDGSPTSEAALPFAEALAHRTGATIALIRAVHTQSMPLIAEAEEYLATFAEQLASRALAVETGVPFGSPAEWILQEIALRKADLVVMATHDRTGPDRWLHGSVAEAVVGRAPVPVLIVRAAQGMRPVERFERRQPTLVVALDGSEAAEAALPTAAQLAADVRAKLVLVSVLPKPGQLVYAEGIGVPHSQEDSERSQREAQAYLESVASQVGAELVLSATLRLGDPATEIVATAELHEAAAVVMATHGRTGVMRTLLGSVAGQVVHTGRLPVVLVRPAKLRGAEEPVGYSTAAAPAS
jgi:nucleotide-binding universal stress UspA family protein